MSLQSNIDALLQGAVDAEEVQAATVLVARDGEPLLARAYGGREPRVERIFDLASMTKPLATSAAAMLLVDSGDLTLSSRVEEVLPALRGAPTGSLSIVRLLNHSSGLPAWRPYYTRVPQRVAERTPRARPSPQRVRRVGAAAVRRAARARSRPTTSAERRRFMRQLVAVEPRLAAPGAQTIYSDLNMMLLAWIVEARAGERLDRFFAGRIAAPLGLQRTFFIDLEAPGRRAELLEQHHFAPTEVCTWRGRRLVAEVHEENCHVAYGIGGHCGLFGSAHDVHRLARELAAAYEGAPSIFSREVVRRFFAHRSAVRLGPPRALGWQLPLSPTSHAGTGFSARSVGHNGTTGTSLWIDLEKRLWVVLLTNRVFYGRANTPMKRLRSTLHDMVHDALG